MFSKDKLEEVWQTGPINWLKDHNKKARGKEQWIVTCKPFTKNYLDPVTTTVWAKSWDGANKQRYDVHDELRKKYPLDQYRDLSFEYTIQRKP